MLPRPDGVVLRCVDFGGSGSGALLIHGLCGTALEWESTAAWLRESHRVIAHDQRGHGCSTRRPADVSHRALVEDAAAVVERFGLAPAVAIAQSLGARVAFLLAAHRPELVCALIAIDGSPQRLPEVVAGLERSLRAWPVPFPSREAAAAHFGGEAFTAQVWAESLAASERGFMPQFDLDVMVAMMREIAERDFWDECVRIESPALVVHGAQSKAVERQVLERMAVSIAHGEFVSVEGAGHDVHLDRPAAWREAATRFLSRTTAR